MNTTRFKIQDFINDEENTMDTYIMNSVCVLLLNFDKIPTPETRVNNNADMFAAVLNKHKEKLNITEDKYKQITTFITKRLSEPLSLLDYLFFYENGKKEVVLTMPLKKVFALVCREMFANIDPYKRADDGEEWKSRLKDRVEALYLCWEELYTDFAEGNSRCHQGVRHALALTLYGFNPLADDLIIMHFASFLEKKAAEYLVKVFKQKDPIWQVQYIVNIIQGKANGELGNQAELTSQLKKYLIVSCAKRGVNIEEQRTVKQINKTITEALNNKNFLENTPEIAAYVHHMRELQKILSSNACDPVTTKVREIFQQCHTFSDLENKGLIALLAANDLKDYLQEFMPIVSCYEQEQEGGELKQEITAALSGLETYYKKFASGDINALQLSEQAKGVLKKRIKSFQAAKSVNDITNFFALFNSSSNPQAVAQYIATKQQVIIFTSDEALEKEFFQLQESEELSLAPYLINRILLHAILCPLDKPWSEIFFNLFKLTLSFLQKLPAEEDALAGKLKRSSYPPKLLKALSALISFKYNDGAKIDDIDFDTLGLLIQLSPPCNQAVVMDEFFYRTDQLARNIHGDQTKKLYVDNLIFKVLGELSPQNGRMAFVSKLTTHANTKQIIYSRELLMLLKLLPIENQAALMQQLGGAPYVQAIYKSVPDLVEDINQYISIEKRWPFINQLCDIGYMQKIATNVNMVGYLLGNVPVENCLDFFNRLGGVNSIKPKIRNAADLGWLLDLSLSQRNEMTNQIGLLQMKLIKQLGGIEYINSITQNADDAEVLLKHLTLKNQETIKNQLQTVKHVIYK